ncbi:MAG: DinB family protein [Taibaiella sp.]|nr:DinB family protein [Taibaiella sp.]
MKQILQQMARYNIWANKQFIDILLKMDDEILDKEITSSFPSIRATVYHMWSAEDIWLQRLLLVEQPVWAQSVFEGSFSEAIDKWQETSKGLLDFVERQYNDDAFRHVLQYYNLKKVSFKLPVYTVLMQVFNHATYHRGQLVTMMRQAGIKKIPGTDFHSFITK